MPHNLEPVDPGSLVFPPSWRDAAIRALYDASLGGVVCPSCRRVFRGGKPKIVEVLSPGALAYEGELLTAMRRWQLLCQIDQMIGNCAEMIVYHSDDYLNSWWTKGEVVTLAHRRSAGSESQPNLRVYDPIRDPERLVVAPPDLMPTMSESQCRRMSWLFAHTHPRLMEPGSVMVSRMIHKAFSHTDSTQRKSHALDRDKGEAAPRLWNPLDFYRDKIWDDKFWDEVLFECHTTGCRKMAAELT